MAGKKKKVVTKKKVSASKKVAAKKVAAKKVASSAEATLSDSKRDELIETASQSTQAFLKMDVKSLPEDVLREIYEREIARDVPRMALARRALSAANVKRNLREMTEAVEAIKEKLAAANG